MKFKYIIFEQRFLAVWDVSKSPAILCDTFSNMVVILLPILEYLDNYPILKQFFFNDLTTLMFT